MSFAHANVFWSDPECMLVSQGALAREQAQAEATMKNFSLNENSWVGFALPD